MKINKILLDFTSGAELWLSYYEDPTFEQQVDSILEQIMPLYKMQHAYVRYKLNKKYGSIVSLEKPIPMHLTGNVWGQDFLDISDLLIPYPAKPVLDVTDQMIAQHYTPLKMFQIADEFYQSLNMSKATNTFWEKSILENPNDGRDLVCYASAWDFFKKDDVR